MPDKKEKAINGRSKNIIKNNQDIMAKGIDIIIMVVDIIIPDITVVIGDHGVNGKVIEDTIVTGIEKEDITDVITVYILSLKMKMVDSHFRLESKMMRC